MGAKNSTKKMDLLRLLTCGSVDDGKSTLIGRLLYDSKAILEDQLNSLKHEDSEEYNLANLTDGLRAEREQGITIDVAYRYFSTSKRKIIIADTPGHVQYTRNMVTGASTANLAILIIDARKGVIEQTRRHAFIASLLRIPHLAICVNKMDLVNYSEEVFENIRKDFTDFSTRIAMRDVRFFPISALKGDNVVEHSQNMPWYTDSPLLSYLENLHIASDINFSDSRFPVQWVIRPGEGEFRDFRGFAGEVFGGVFHVGDEVIVLPSGRSSRIKSIYTYDGEIKFAFPPMSVTLLLEDEIDISRGDLIVNGKSLPYVESEVTADICWMAEDALALNRKYKIRHCTNTLRGMISRIEYRVDISTLEEDAAATTLGLNDIGRVKLKFASPLSFDAYAENRQMGCFIVVDEVTNNTVGVGMLIAPQKTVLRQDTAEYAI